MSFEEKKDVIKIEVLENGVIRIETDPISGANHTDAENLLSEIGRLAGGETKREPKSHGHHHHHGDVAGHKHH